MMERYRPLIMLAVGIGFIYLVISLHSAPYPYPQNIMMSQEDLFGKIKPNGLFMSVQEDWVYLTAIWKEHEVNDDNDDDDATIDLGNFGKKFLGKLENV